MVDLDRSTWTSDTIRCLLDIFPDPALLLSSEQRVLGVNRAFFRQFGCGESVVGRRCYELLHAADEPCRDGDCPVRAAEAGNGPGRALHVHHGPEGEEHQHVTVYPIEPSGFLEIVQPCRVASPSPHPHRPFGRSTAFNRMLELAHRVARAQTPVLLIGEPGTGKEQLARSIHRLGAEHQGSFVPMDCSGRDQALLERELFGHEAQAGTGSASRTRGAIELAAGGTLYLNQVAELPLLLQDQLLRVLETGIFRRVGGNEPLPVRMRLICGTHRDLRREVGEGAFRMDLFHRIGAFPIPIPPLRERPEDLEPLIRWILEDLSGGRRVEIRTEALAALETHPLPGNLRELRYILERACLLADGGPIGLEHLEQGDLAWPGPEAGLRPGTDIVPLAELESRYLTWAAATFEGDNTALAQRLGIGERTLYRKLRLLRKGNGGPPLE